MLLNTGASPVRCSDADSDSDNFSVDSLDNERATSNHGKQPQDPTCKMISLHQEYEVSTSLNKSYNKSTDLNQNYGYDKSQACELPFDSGIEQLVEANISKVDILLPSESCTIENVKTKFEKKTARRSCQHSRAKSVSSPRKVKEYNQAFRKEMSQLQVSNNHLPRSLSSDSASLLANIFHCSPVRKTAAKLTPKKKPNKKNVSYLAQYRGQNPHYQASEDNHDMKESPSQVSVISSQDDESQFYSDIMNGKINEWGQSECDNNGAEHELASASVQDLKSISEINCDSNHSLSYVPYTAKDRLLVLPTKLGSLGPDPLSYREKAESCKKRQQYGIFASLKNMEMIRQRSLKKMISEALNDLQENTSDDEISTDQRWECCSSSHSSSSSKLEVQPGCVTPSNERRKTQPRQGCGKFKKKVTTTEDERCSSKEINYVKTESNLDMINKLLRDRHKNELIINHF